MGSASHSGVRRRRLRALIVDDDSELRRAVGALLAREGFQAQGAANGAEALAVLESGLHVSVALIDLRMPVLDGWSTIARIHRSRHAAHTRIIVFTDAGDRSILPLTAAIDGYVPKPLCPDRLLATVRHVLSIPAATPDGAAHG
jgi:two-component system chemotaxis response regulator CheY